MINPAPEELVHISKAEQTDNLVDLFCGCGGSGSGILDGFEKLGRNPRGTFVNHWDRAIDIHESNHPEHRHLREDLFLLAPQTVFPPGTDCTLLWGSPSCVQFSVSRGNRPINEQGRSHADTLVAWVEHLLPECVMVENVKEFLKWGPLRQRRDKHTRELQWARETPTKKKKVTTKPCHKLPVEHLRRADEAEEAWEARMLEAGYCRHLEPDPEQAGTYFNAWRDAIKAVGPGYDFDYRLIRSADHGDPTIRLRFYGQFVRRDSGKRVCFPAPRYTKPDKNGRVPEGLLPWPTARDSVIDWTIKGTSVFSREKALVKATFRRLAIGLVKFGLQEFLVPKDNFDGERTRSVDFSLGSLTTEHRGEGLARCQTFLLTSNKSFGEGVRSVSQPACTLTTHGRGEGMAEMVATWLVPNFGERVNQKARTHKLEGPLPTVTSHGAGGLCELYSFLLPKVGLNPHMSEPRELTLPFPAVLTDGRSHLCETKAYVLPKDQGHKADYVVSTASPCPAVQTTSVDHVAQAFMVQLNGQSVGAPLTVPLGCITGCLKLQLAQPMVVHLRGKNSASSVDIPLRALTAGGMHELLAEAMVMVVDNAGKGSHRDRLHSMDEPLRTLPTKANQSAVRFSLHALEEAVEAVAPAGVDISRVTALLQPLMEELQKAGKADVKPWVYVYYGSGSVGAPVDSPLPTARTKENLAVCYPVLEYDGGFILLDILYRMLTPKELQRAMGFKDDFVWPPGITKTDMVKAIGNSVSRGTAEALTLAFYSQQEDIRSFFPEEFGFSL